LDARGEPPFCCLLNLSLSEEEACVADGEGCIGREEDAFNDTVSIGVGEGAAANDGDKAGWCGREVVCLRRVSASSSHGIDEGLAHGESMALRSRLLHPPPCLASGSAL
jgi:hypothetical protein